MRIILFDVEHGFCAFVRSPNGYALMIDCGKAANFSPVHYIGRNELAGVQSFNGKALAELIVTHPHEDHIEDIAHVVEFLPPAFLLGRVYNWDVLKTAEAREDCYQCLDTYAQMKARYCEFGGPRPDWGMNIQTFCLEADSLGRLRGSVNSRVNNSSYVVLITCHGTRFSNKFLFAGDMEEAGWEELLLRNPQFRQAVSNTDFYFASHHGHTSGFSTELFAAMGRPLLNLVSVTSCDESHDCRYSSEDYSAGFRINGVNGESRRMLSTRRDGAICIETDAEGFLSVTTGHISPNIAVQRRNAGLFPSTGVRPRFNL